MVPIVRVPSTHEGARHRLAFGPTLIRVTYR
jgi:hypothetical protein